MNKIFKFKVKEVIGYIEHSRNDTEDSFVDSVDIYLSGGQIITINLSKEDCTKEDLEEILGFDENYWDYIKIKETNTIQTKSVSKVKPTTYNPYE